MNPDICDDALKLNAVRGTSTIKDVSPVEVSLNHRQIQFDIGLSIAILQVESSLQTYMDMDMGKEKDIEELVNYLDVNQAALLR